VAGTDRTGRELGPAVGPPTRPGRSFVPVDPASFWNRRLTVQAATVALTGIPAVLLATAVAPPTAGSLFATAATDLAYSFARMLGAYLLSLAFALGYGYLAATSRTGERVLIPVLDVLQSIPILGFFPPAIIFFVNAAGPGNPLGPNLASMFLIFTSMSWNMAFGVYETLKSLPTELREASDVFGARGLFRARTVIVPATVNRLVYNSVLSWTNGWYFLVAAEFIATASSTTALPGIGTFLLSNATGAGSTTGLVIGLALLVVLIAGLDIALWRPLARWAQRFRYDQTPSGESEAGEVGAPRAAPLRRAAGVVVAGMRQGVSRLGTPFLGLASIRIGGRARPESPYRRAAVRYVALGAALVVCWLLLIALGVGVFDVFTGPIAPAVRSQIAGLPLALGASFGRVVLAYAICLAISVPLALALYRRPRTARFGLPAVEIIASVPATALFPVFLVGLLGVIGPEPTSILMIVTGMIWYLFFNVLSGLRAIPLDLVEAANSYGLPSRQFFRKLALPAILPALVTGSITAFGGGWNTLVIAENVRYGSTIVLQVPGVGELIDMGNFEGGGYPLMVAALFALVLAVVGLNELVWKPLYRRAVDRYRLE